MEFTPMRDDPDATRRTEPSRKKFVTKTDDYTIPATEPNETVFVANDAGDGVIFSLPAAAKGRRFKFMKANSTTDLHLQATGGAKINFGTANKIYESVTDGNGVPVAATVVSDGVDWFVESQIGTWANNNS